MQNKLKKNIVLTSTFNTEMLLWWLDISSFQHGLGWISLPLHCSISSTFYHLFGSLETGILVWRIFPVCSSNSLCQVPIFRNLDNPFALLVHISKLFQAFTFLLPFCLKLWSKLSNIVFRMKRVFPLFSYLQVYPWGSSHFVKARPP